MNIRKVDPSHRAESLEELLALDGADFVLCAYVTLLGRQPDVIGRGFYLQLLLEGRSKLDLLWRLRRSSEGKRHDPGIAGLDRALRRARIARAPFVGGVARLIYGIAERDGPVDRALRSVHFKLDQIIGAGSSGSPSAVYFDSGHQSASQSASVLPDKEPSLEIDLKTHLKPTSGLQRYLYASLT